MYMKKKKKEKKTSSPAFVERRAKDSLSFPVQIAHTTMRTTHLCSLFCIIKRNVIHIYFVVQNV